MSTVAAAATLRAANSAWIAGVLSMGAITLQAIAGPAVRTAAKAIGAKRRMAGTMASPALNRR
jgi:hypothetical protein